MLTFRHFKRDNEEHIKMARESINVLVEDEHGFIRFGRLYEEYLGDGRNAYRISSQSFEFPENAEHTLWCPVQVERY